MRVEPGGLGRYIGASAPSIRMHPDGGLSMVFTTVVEPPFPWNWLYLRDEKAVLGDIEEDLKDRAKMGRQQLKDSDRLKEGKTAPAAD